MAKRDYSQFIKYGVAKTSFNSSRNTWEQEKNWEYAYMITEGLAHGTFFPANIGAYVGETLVDTKEEAKNGSYKIRDYAAYDRARARSGYSAYKDRIWVHEFLTKNGRNGVYLPTVGEVKKGIEYIKANLQSEDFRQDWVDWAVAHDGMTPAQVREELIENFLKD